MPESVTGFWEWNKLGDRVYNPLYGYGEIIGTGQKECMSDGMTDQKVVPK
jgi:hypothetical protein